MTVKEAAEYIGISLPTIYRAIAAGRIPSLQLTPGGKMFIPRKALERLLNGE